MQYNELVNKVRNLPLSNIAEKLGLLQQYNGIWSSQNFVITITGQKFYDHYVKTGGGGAIDLVKHVLFCDFHESVKWLSESFNREAVESAVRSQAREYVKTAKETGKNPFKLPQKANERAWNKVRNYLTQERKLSPELVDKLHQNGDIYASEYDGYTNAVFVNKYRNSAEIRGVQSSFQGIVPGSKIDSGGLRVTVGNEPKSLVITESAVDTISYAELQNGNFVAMSSIGARYEAPYIKKALNNGWSVVCAYDNDKQGEEGFNKLKEQYPGIERERPTNKDWNDDLKRSKKAQRKKGQC